MSLTIDAFVESLSLKKYAIYIFDYGAPTGLRHALRHPENVVAIVSQNGNAYEEGFGEFWAPIQKYWKSGSQKDRDAIRWILEIGATKWQYSNGNPKAAEVDPETYSLDQALMDRKGNKDIQLDLFYDYRTNVPLYPNFQEYLRNSKIPVLAIWGKGDAIFIPPGAEAFKRDVEKLELKFLDAGHFAIENNEQEFADDIVSFFGKYNVF